MQLSKSTNYLTSIRKKLSGFQSYDLSHGELFIKLPCELFIKLVAIRQQLASHSLNNL